MRRLTRRRAVPYKSPRLFTMLALLVCLVVLMNSLRSMRGPGPGPGAPRMTPAPSNQVDSSTVEDEGLVISISIYSTPEGEIEKLEIGQRAISAPTIEELLPAFRTALADIVQLGCDTVSVRVGEDLRNERLIQIVDICGKQELPSGERLSKVSIVPLKTNLRLWE